MCSRAGASVLRRESHRCIAIERCDDHGRRRHCPRRALLPPRAGFAARVAQPEPEREAPAPASGCVLLVEDDPQVTALVTDMLESSGYGVLRAAGADAALDVLASERQVDFPLSDIMMLGSTSGMGLARQVQASRQDLPILLSSGFAEPSRAEADRSGI